MESGRHLRPYDMVSVPEGSGRRGRPRGSGWPSQWAACSQLEGTAPGSLGPEGEPAHGLLGPSLYPHPQ